MLKVLVCFCFVAIYLNAIAWFDLIEIFNREKIDNYLKLKTF